MIESPPESKAALAQVEAPIRPGGIALSARAVVPDHLLDGGEIIILAVKPSLWFIPFVSLLWLATAALLIAAAVTGLAGAYKGIAVQAGLLVALVGLAYATLQWVSRYYVLTNRRVMRIRGVVSVEVFECALTRIQNTSLVFSVPERLTATGSIHMTTAGAVGQASWRIVARPLEVHEQLRAAIGKAQQRGNSGV